MLRLSKLTDYATVLLSDMADDPAKIHTAADLARHTRIGAPTVSKVLKQLTHGGVLVSVRGPSGGYRLALPAEQISVAAIIDCMEGPVSLTQCSDQHDDCALASHCRTRSHWPRINRRILDTLRDLTIAELSRPAPPTMTYQPLDKA